MQKALIQSDDAGVITLVNVQACKLFGYAREELIGQNVRIFMDEPYRSQHHHYIERLKHTERPLVLGTSRVVEGLHKDGHSLMLRIALSRIITNDKTFYLALFEQLPDTRIVIVSDSAGKITAVSPTVEDVLGYKTRNVVGKSISVLVPSPHDSLHDSYMHDYVRRGCPAQSSVVGVVRNVTARHADGYLVPVALRVSKHAGPAPTWTAAAAVTPAAPIGDDNAVVHFRGELTPLDRELDVVITIDSRGIIKSVNEAFTTIFGYERHQAVGMNVKMLATPPHSELHDLYMERYRTHHNAHIVGKGVRRVYGKHKDGSTFLVDLKVEEFQEDGACFFRGNMSRVFPAAKPAGSSGSAAADEDDLPDGMIIGMYRLVGTIGKGYFGKVKSAIHSITGEKVAIKTLRRKQYEKIGMAFPPREIKLLQRLRHRHVCQLLDIIDTHDKIYLVQEFVPGGELYEYSSKRNILHEDEARHFMRQISCGLAYIHRQGVAHRDLKAENILLDKAGNARIIDLGLGNFYTPGNLLNTFCGTPAYAAPELWRAKPYDGAGVDVWSLGVMLYLMLTGALPFADIQDVLVARYKAPSCSTEARELLGAILTPEPEKRLTLRQMMDHPWMNRGYDFKPYEEPLALKSESIDEELLSMMPSYGLSADETRSALLNHEQNTLTATYSLLWTKREREHLASEGVALPEEVRPSYPRTDSDPNRADSEGKPQCTVQ